MLAIEAMPDQRHVAARMHPQVSISKVAQEMKGTGSHHINHLPVFRDARLWQGGYGAFSFWLGVRSGDRDALRANPGRAPRT